MLIKREHRKFKVGENLFLKVKSKRILLKLRRCIHEILEKIGLVIYMLALLSSMRIHNVFHVSLSKNHVPDTNHVIDWNMIQVEHEGDL
jgi:hypothetical protein